MSNYNDLKRGIYGSGYDRLVERFDDSTISKMQQQYWEAKQIYLKNVKRKEDDCIVASDSELDAKLELFRSIEDTCSMLLWTLERFQDRIWVMAHEESSLGRFLREAGRVDKTRAGTMLTASGKTMSFIANQRIQLRNPLVRLYQDIETFQYRAVTDTYETIDKMESTRTAYRAALLWMKDISSKLDPDSYKQLEKFRKIQAHVRRSKQRFEKVKIDTYQKIDMLAASRVNMFSHSLGLYQREWLAFYEKSSRVMNQVNEAFAGYQYYDFNILKQLTEPQKKAIHAGGLVNAEIEKKLNAILGDDPKSKGQMASKEKPEESATSAGEDKLLFFDTNGAPPKPPQSMSIVKQKDGEHSTKEDDLLGLNTSEPESQGAISSRFNDLLADIDEISNNLVDLPQNEPLSSNLETKGSSKKTGSESKRKGQKLGEKTEISMTTNLEDLLTSAEPDERQLLSEIFAGPVIGPSEAAPSTKSTDLLSDLFSGEHQASSHFLPSQLLDSSLQSLNLSTGESPVNADLTNLPKLNPSETKNQKSGIMKGRPKEKTPMENWLNLFAELDPLADPDAIGHDSQSEKDRNC